MGRTGESHAAAKANIDAWLAEADGDEGGLDAVVVNTSGCGTTVKDYGHMLRTDPDYAEKAARISALARDVTELLAEIGLPEGGGAPSDLAVAYHSACSLQHGQGVDTVPKALLAEAGFGVLDIAEGHLCCGSAGTYNLLQPDLAGQLKTRKVANIERTGADIVAAGNIGCIMQIADGTSAPVVHTVQLLDWATGGPAPPAFAAHETMSGTRAAATAS
jgi:glycolate oxidase iron-sulfur subunit